MTRYLAFAPLLLLLACGQVVEGQDAATADAGADVDATDARTDACVRNGQPDFGDRCCSHFAIDHVCAFQCSPTTLSCVLPDAPCCADAGQCIQGVCQ